MISESFTNIVNPNNIIEEFYGEVTTSSTDPTNVSSNDGSDVIDLNKYPEFVSNMNSSCKPIISELKMPDLQIGESCLVDNKKYFKSDMDYVSLRKKYLENMNAEMRKVHSGIKMSDYDKVTREICLMSKMLDNIKIVSKKNKEIEKEINDKDHMSRENEKIIDLNKQKKKSNENSNLVSKANTAGSKITKKYTYIEYIIIVSLLVLFLVIQMIIFFV